MQILAFFIFQVSVNALKEKSPVLKFNPIYSILYPVFNNIIQNLYSEFLIFRNFFLLIFRMFFYISQ